MESLLRGFPKESLQKYQSHFVQVLNSDTLQRCLHKTVFVYVLVCISRGFTPLTAANSTFITE